MKSAFCVPVMRLGLATLALGAAALGAPGVAAAANPSCGQTITHNVKLTSNLNCSGHPGDALVVGKPGITINLNGHTLTGPGYLSYTGIDNSSGYDKVTIENGTVEDFEYTVDDAYTTGARILNLTSSETYYGIYVVYSQKGTIEHSTAENSTDTGFYLYDNSNVDVSNSKAVDDAYGLFDEYSLSTIDKLKANNDDYGIYVEEPLAVHGTKGWQYYTVEHSTANDNSTDGVYIEENYSLYDQADLLSNTANDNGDYGFYADAKAKGKGNHATGNGTANCWHVSCK